MINVLEDPHQLLIDNILDDLYVIVINRKIASFETSIDSLDQEASSVEVIIERLRRLFTKRKNAYNPLSIKYITDEQPLREKQAPRQIETKVERLLSNRKYSIFLSESDAILGRSMYEFDYTQKQQAMVEQRFSVNAATTGNTPEFNHTLSVSLNTAPTVQTLPLKEALPNVYQLFDAFVKNKQK